VWRPRGKEPRRERPAEAACPALIGSGPRTIDAFSKIQVRLEQLRHERAPLLTGATLHRGRLDGLAVGACGLLGLLLQSANARQGSQLLLLLGEEPRELLDPTL